MMFKIFNLLLLVALLSIISQSEARSSKKEVTSKVVKKDHPNLIIRKDEEVHVEHKPVETDNVDNDDEDEEDEEDVRGDDNDDSEEDEEDEDESEETDISNNEDREELAYYGNGLEGMEYTNRYPLCALLPDESEGRQRRVKVHVIGGGRRGRRGRRGGVIRLRG